jgi:hypothetical protein
MTPTGDTIHPFFVGDDVHGNVVFNFHGNPVNDLAAFAAGYHDGAKVLVANMEAKLGYADYEGYPIFFLYRHALELYLKAIVYRGALLCRLASATVIRVDKLFARHDLARLLPPVKEIFDHVGWNWQVEVPGLESWEGVSKLVRAIDGIDRGSSSFRYPVTSDGSAPLQRHLVLNAIAFGHRMDPLLDILGGAVTGLDDTWDTWAKKAHFLQELINEWRGDC